MNKRLSEEAKQILTELRIYKGSFLRKHMNPSGQTSWKLMDEQLNPVKVYTDNKVQECLQSGHLIRTENGLSFNRSRIETV